MTITQLSDITGVSKHTLRYYERLGLVPLVGRDRSSGHRRYTPGHAEWIRFLRQLRETGMPLRDMRTYARLVTKGDSTWVERKLMLAEHRDRVDAEIALLRKHRRLLSRKLVLDCAPAGLGRVRDG